MKLYRNFYIASLPCYLSVFVSLSVMIVFYTGADEIVGNRALHWATGVLDLVFFFLMYILTPNEEGYQIW